MNDATRDAKVMRLDVGGGYRFIAESDVLGHQLRSPSGSIARQFGGR